MFRFSILSVSIYEEERSLSLPVRTSSLVGGSDGIGVGLGDGTEVGSVVGSITSNKRGRW